MRQQERIVAEIIRAAGADRWVGIYEIDRGRQRVVNLACSGPLDRKRRVSSVAASEPQHRLLSIRARRDSRRRETRRNQQGGTRAGATRRKGVPLQHASRRTFLAARLYRHPERTCDRTIPGRGSAGQERRKAWKASAKTSATQCE